MLDFQMFKQKNGFSLIELIVCLIIVGILSQIGFIAFRSYSRRARAFAAKTALINVMKECQTNKKLNSDESFTRLEPTSYSFASSKNNCNGNKS